MYIFNKTSEYIHTMPEHEFDEKLKQIITTSHNEQVQKAKQRENEKNKNLLKKQEEKQQQIEYRRREELATTVIDASLWQKRQTVIEKSASIDVTKGVGGVRPPNNFIYFLNI